MSCQLVRPPDASPVRRTEGGGSGDAAAAPGLLARRNVGPLTISLLAVANAVLWLVAKPVGEPFGRFLGQLMGAESVLLLSIGLVLITILPWVEDAFDGADRAVLWHRRVALAGMVLLIPHIALSSNPNPTRLGGPLAVAGTLGLVVLMVWAVLPSWRSVTPAPLRRVVLALATTPPVRLLRRIVGGYDRWRSLHRLTGLFVAAGFVHGVMDATVFAASPLLRWSYLTVGGVGVAAYAYAEVVAPVLPQHEYRVERASRVEKGLLEVVLTPVGKPLKFTAGQFAMVSLKTEDGWHRHPFTLSSASSEPQLRVLVKALGDYTSELPELAQPGTPAVVSDPHGRFNRPRSTHDQIWVAAGVGVTPFLSWARSLDPDDPADIDFFYSARGRAPFTDELLEIARDHPGLRLHLADTSRQGRLTPEAVLAAAGKRPDQVTVFVCGPAAMADEFDRGLRAAGVARARIRYEHFAWR